MKRTPLRHAASFPANGGRGIEYLELAGVIDDAGGFRSLPIRSQAVVRRRAVAPEEGAEEPPIEVELLDKSEATLSREILAQSLPVVCSRQDPGWRLVRGHIALLPGAALLRISRGGRPLHERPILPAPTLRLEWPHREVTRKRGYPLELDCSPHGEGALIEVHLLTPDGRSRFMGAGTPKKRLTLRFDDLPGGGTCRLSVTYSNGMRSTTAVTGEFTLAPRKGRVVLLHPEADLTAPPWQPIPLQAGWRAGDGEGRSAERQALDGLVWELDGQAVERGPRGLLAGLDEGEHQLVLRAGGRQVGKRRIRIVRPKGRSVRAAFEW